MTDLIIHEDEYIWVINKPKGLAAQSDKADGETVLDLLAAEEKHPVNRLDQRVSGLMIVAKTADSVRVFSDLLRNNKIKKRYRTITLKGLQEGTYENFLFHQKKIQKALVVDIKHKDAKFGIIKVFKVAESSRYQLSEIEIKGGRFHQIRAQLSHLKFPILGDLKYGYPRSSPDGSIFLQAYSLAFVHPFTGESLSFILEMPEVWGKYGF